MVTQETGIKLTAVFITPPSPFVNNPDPRHISTSYAERQNLNMRMSMRRFTSWNAFSKKTENHAHATDLHFMYYNFGRIHKTLRITPAVAAGRCQLRLAAGRE